MHPATPRYQPVIGLEVHIQLQTQTKVFGPEGYSFGAEPNTCLSAVTYAHPGALPQVNESVIYLATKLGLATGCEISRYAFFDRKNYFYPDLPKGYQITQDNKPICREGFLDLLTGTAAPKRIRIQRIHMEEDAGKSLHDQDPHDTLIDLNRAGMGLLELVTHPDLREAEEAAAFVQEIRKIVRYLEVSDADMEKGNLRCDANISVMEKTSTVLGTRVEVKNLNSFTNLAKAIQYEIQRQISLLEAGEKVEQETRTFDVGSGQTFPMRDKESADDYRYFPEPDLLPIRVSEAWLEQVREELPELPQSRWKRYTGEWDIPENEAFALVEDRLTADFFEQLAQASGEPKASAAWVLGPVRAYMNEHNLSWEAFPLSPPQIGQLIGLVSASKVSFSAAKDRVLPALIQQPGQDPETLIRKLDVVMESDDAAVSTAMEQLIQQFPDEVQRYRKGKKGLQGFFVGKIMQEFKGKANPKTVNQVVKKMLDA